MTHLLSLAVIISLTTLSATAAPTGRSARELHTAECVAALEVSTEALAKQVKAGREELRTPLLRQLKSGAAFIGAAYLHGERDEARARALLKDALEAQEALSEPALVARQVACAEEGTRLLADTDFIARVVVSRLAEKRMNKLLGR